MLEVCVCPGASWRWLSVGLADVGIAVDGVLGGVFRSEKQREWLSEMVDLNNTDGNELKLLTSVGLADVGITIDGVVDGVFRGERWSE